MKAGSLALVAALSLAAIVLAFTSLPRWVALLLLVAAGVFLFIGLRDKYRYRAYSARESAPIELDDEQRDTVSRLKGEGREDSAIRQVQLWFRNTSYGEAAAVVRDID